MNKESGEGFEQRRMMEKAQRELGEKLSPKLTEAVEIIMMAMAEASPYTEDKLHPIMRDLLYVIDELGHVGERRGMKNVSETIMLDGSRLWDDGFGELFSSHSTAVISHRKKADVVYRKVESKTFSEAADATSKAEFELGNVGDVTAHAAVCKAERELGPDFADVKEMLKGVNEELADFGIKPIHVMQAPGRITFLPPSEARTPTLKDSRECLIWLHAFSYALDLVADKRGIAPGQGGQSE